LYIVCAVAAPQIKEQIINRITNKNIKFPILIHPNALIGNRQYVSIGEGSIITAGTIITQNIRIGKHVILNLLCTVGHDTIIGDFSSFMPSVNISGEVVIHNNVYVGTGAKIINQLTIGQHSIIGAGAVVSKNIPERCTAVGVPAKPIKFHS
jgi:sugar O-acyltransferase (sialic acid O-acetyltransferase NeuD family)